MQEDTHESRTAKIVLDLSDSPAQEMRLIAVLSEMVKVAIAKEGRTSRPQDMESTRHVPGHETKAVVDVPAP
jgi:hypothetical protein